jgi:hypothetical protein
MCYTMYRDQKKAKIINKNPLKITIFMKKFSLSQRFMHKSTRRAVSIVALFALVFGMNLSFINVAQAATITSAKDTLSTITDSAEANHTLSWVSPSGVANAATITITFPTGFSLTGIVEDDVDIAGSSEGELTTAADCSGSEDASVAVVTQTMTITLCTGDGGDFTNSETITVEIGTHAAASGTGANQINNQTEAQNNSDPVIDITSGASDTGSVAVEIIADDSVNVTATVDPSITFSISDVTIGFGTLTTGAARYANGAATGDAAVTPAHTLSAGTNAAGGLSVTYNGALLTSAGNNIDAATITGDANGTPGTEQFAISFDDNGSAFSMVSGYDQASDNASFVASTTTQIFSAAAPLASTSVDAHYMANIAANTPAGNYATNITYIATGTF